MGLALSVGILADLGVNDPEGADYFRETFERLNSHLVMLGMQRHAEPEQCDGWSGEMYGYSGLHYLRRIAAHLDTSGSLPEPGDDSSSSDAVLEDYFADVSKAAPPLIAKLFRKRSQFSRSFDHLILHSDAEGFYLPYDFAQVVFTPERLAIPGGMVGSAPRLCRELDRLAAALEIPERLTSSSEELWEAADSQGSGDAKWQRYGIESFSCVTLREGCRHALQTGAALVFT